MIQHRNPPPSPPGTPPLPDTIRFARLKLLEEITYRFYKWNDARGGWLFDERQPVTLPQDSILDVSVDTELNTFSIKYYQRLDGQRTQVYTDHNMIDVRVEQNFVDGHTVRDILIFQPLDLSKYEELGLDDEMRRLRI